MKRQLASIARKLIFPGSGEYWKKRYVDGGLSGPGSYSRLAEFKADTINEFVKTHAIQSVIEFGCGDGNQLALSRYPSYIGLDVSAVAISRCAEKFSGDDTKSFFLYEPKAFIDRGPVFSADLTMSLDVVYHLIEDSVFEAHMKHLFSASRKFVIIYSSDTDSNPFGQPPHIRHRIFTGWIKDNLRDWTLLEKIPNRYPFKGDDKSGSFADFFIYRREP